MRLCTESGHRPPRVWQEGLKQEPASHLRGGPRRGAGFYIWFRREGLTFDLGVDDEATERTERQVLQPCASYVAAVRIAHAGAVDLCGDVRVG